MKKIITIITVLMVFIVSGCSSNSTATVISDSVDYSNQTIYGQIDSIDGSNITITLGAVETVEPLQMQDMEIDNDEDTQGQAVNNQQPGNQQSNGQQSNTPPDKPEGTDVQANGNNPPDMPQGESGEQGGNTPPDMPQNGNVGEGENSGQPQDMGNTINFTASEETLIIDASDLSISKDNQEISYEKLESEDILEIVFDENNNIASITVLSNDNGPMNNNFGGSSEVTQGSYANIIDSDTTVSGQTYTSSGDDENALRVDAATVTLDSININKESGSTSNTENGDFYGVNAALLATNGANVTIKNATVTSNAQNGNGVFSYGSGTTVNIYDSTITTYKDNSGGIQTTGGATTNAYDLTIETNGNSSAAIRSDRGGGNVNVTGGTYTSNGYNSPAVYSTATIKINGATLTANNSEALVIEGANSIDLTNCIISGNMSNTKGTSSDENVHNVMVYQSMSGDAAVGTSSLTLTDCTLTSNNGDMFYVTNTNAVLTLTNVKLINNDSDSYLFNICGNSGSHGWGNAGSNGATVTLTCSNQQLDGDIVVDSISTLDLTLSNNSSLNGTINIVDNVSATTTLDSNINVTIDSGSSWTLTGNCTISTLTNNGTINYNGYTITLADGTVLE